MTVSLCKEMEAYYSCLSMTLDREIKTSVKSIIVNSNVVKDSIQYIRETFKTIIDLLTSSDPKDKEKGEDLLLQLMRYLEDLLEGLRKNVKHVKKASKVRDHHHKKDMDKLAKSSGLLPKSSKDTKTSNVEPVSAPTSSHGASK